MNKCYLCGCDIKEERWEALEILETPINIRSCLNCASNSFNKGLFLGENGASQFIVVSHLGESGIKRD